MYRLFSRVPNGLQPMAKIVQGHIEKMGNEIVNQREARIQEEGEKDSNQDPGFVKALLTLHDKFLALVNQQFEKNSLFHKALKEAFQEFVNKDVGKYKNADLMSSFCDRILKKGGEKLSDEEVEENLEKVRGNSCGSTRHTPHDAEPSEGCLTSACAVCGRVSSGGEPVHILDGQGPVRGNLPKSAGEAAAEPAVLLGRLGEAHDRQAQAPVRRAVHGQGAPPYC
jgi:Ca2+-binding EF-hand superfamily protein